MPNCESHSVQIGNTYKKVATDLLNLFTEFNSQNESLVALLSQYSTDINSNKEAIVDILDQYIQQRMLCCYNLVQNIDAITVIFGQLPCIETITSTTTTLEPTTTEAEEPTTTLNEDICNAPTVVNVKGSYYPYEVVKFLGAELGLVTLTFDAHDIPDRYVVEFDGNIVIDTGYVGNPVFQPYLDAAVILEGDVAGDITNIETASLSFLKNSAVETATVKVYSPLGNSRLEFTLSCPVDSIVCQDIILDVVEIDFIEPTTTLDCAMEGDIELNLTTTTLEVTTTYEATTTIL